MIRRLRDLIDAVLARTAAWPAAILALLQQALALRYRAAAADVSPHGLAVASGRLLAEIVCLLEVPRRHPALARFAAHLDTELTALFTFLVVPGTDATNWRAEQGDPPRGHLNNYAGPSLQENQDRKRELGDNHAPSRDPVQRRSAEEPSERRISNVLVTMIPPTASLVLHGAPPSFVSHPPPSRQAVTGTLWE